VIEAPQGHATAQAAYSSHLRSRMPPLDTIQFKSSGRSVPKCGLHVPDCSMKRQTQCGNDQHPGVAGPPAPQLQATSSCRGHFPALLRMMRRATARFLMMRMGSHAVHVPRPTGYPGSM